MFLRASKTADSSIRNLLRGYNLSTLSLIRRSYSETKQSKTHLDDLNPFMSKTYSKACGGLLTSVGGTFAFLFDDASNEFIPYMGLLGLASSIYGTYIGNPKNQDLSKDSHIKEKAFALITFGNALNFYYIASLTGCDNPSFLMSAFLISGASLGIPKYYFKRVPTNETNTWKPVVYASTASLALSIIGSFLLATEPTLFALRIGIWWTINALYSYTIHSKCLKFYKEGKTDSFELLSNSIYRKAGIFIWLSMLLLGIREYMAKHPKENKESGNQ